MGYDPRAIANYMLDYADSRSRPVTHLALQKILYFCHGWYLAKFDRPLFSETAEAWSHGPVYKSVYRNFKEAKRNPILLRATALDYATGHKKTVRCELDETTAKFVENIFDAYSQYTALELRAMSHQSDGPWDRIWQKAKGGVVPGMRIPDELIRDCFLQGKTGLTEH